MSGQDITLMIAVYGAVVSSIALIWQFLDWIINFLNYRRDKADIRIWAKGNYKVHPPNTIYGDKSYIRVEVSNRGRRPTTITGCSVRLPQGSEVEGDWLLIGDSIKRVRIEEGDSHYYMVEEGQIKDYNLTDKDIVVCVNDATGRFYWADNVIKRWIKLWRCRNKIKSRKKG